MLQLEVLVGELVSVDGLATSAVVVCEVSTLTHEVLDDTVEAGSLESEALLHCAQRPEVLRRLGDYIITQLHNDPSYFVAIGCDVEENPGSSHG